MDTERHDVQARGVRQPSRQQAPYASSAESGIHSGAAADFRQHGKKAIEKVASEQPAATSRFLRCWCLASTRSSTAMVKAMSDEQLERASRRSRPRASRPRSLKGTVETAALPAPELGRQAQATEPAARCCRHRGRAEGTQAEEAQAVAWLHLIAGWIGPGAQAAQGIIACKHLASRFWPRHTRLGSADRQALVACSIVRYAGR